MTNQGELLKLAAARIVQKELEKEAQLGSLLGLAALGFAGTKLFPEQWANIKDWISNKLRGPGAVEADAEEETPEKPYRPAFDSAGRPIQYKNPYWRRGRNITGDDGKLLWMRGGYKGRMIDGLKNSDPYKNYSVESGDTLSGIANTYGLNLQDIINANKGISDPNLINIGQNIRLPGGR